MTHVGEDLDGVLDCAEAGGLEGAHVEDVDTLGLTDELEALDTSSLLAAARMLAQYTTIIRTPPYPSEMAQRLAQEPMGLLEAADSSKARGVPPTDTGLQYALGRDLSGLDTLTVKLGRGWGGSADGRDGECTGSVELGCGEDGAGCNAEGADEGDHDGRLEMWKDEWWDPSRRRKRRDWIGRCPVVESLLGGGILLHAYREQKAALPPTTMPALCTWAGEWPCGGFLGFRRV